MGSRVKGVDDLEAFSPNRCCRSRGDCLEVVYTLYLPDAIYYQSSLSSHYVSRLFRLNLNINLYPFALPSAGFSVVAKIFDIGTSSSSINMALSTLSCTGRISLPHMRQGKLCSSEQGKLEDRLESWEKAHLLKSRNHIQEASVDDGRARPFSTRVFRCNQSRTICTHYTLSPSLPINRTTILEKAVHPEHEREGHQHAARQSMPHVETPTLGSVNLEAMR